MQEKEEALQEDVLDNISGGFDRDLNFMNNEGTFICPMCKKRFIHKNQSYLTCPSEKCGYSGHSYEFSVSR